MASIYTNVLSDEEIDYLNNLPEVLTAKVSLDARPSGSICRFVTSYAMD